MYSITSYFLISGNMAGNCSIMAIIWRSSRLPSLSAKSALLPVSLAFLETAPARISCKMIFSSMPIRSANCLTYKDLATLSLMAANGAFKSATTRIFPSVDGPCLAMDCSIKNDTIPGA